MSTPPLSSPPWNRRLTFCPPESSSLYKLNQQQLRVPHISPSFGEMWEMKLLSIGHPYPLSSRR